MQEQGSSGPKDKVRLDKLLSRVLRLMRDGGIEIRRKRKDDSENIEADPDHSFEMDSDSEEKVKC